MQRSRNDKHQPFCPSPRASKNITSAANTKASRWRMVARRTHSASRVSLHMQPAQRRQNIALARVQPALPSNADPKARCTGSAKPVALGCVAGSPNGSQTGGLPNPPFQAGTSRSPRAAEPPQPEKRRCRPAPPSTPPTAAAHRPERCGAAPGTSLRNHRPHGVAAPGPASAPAAGNIPPAIPMPIKFSLSASSAAAACKLRGRPRKPIADDPHRRRQCQCRTQPQHAEQAR